MNLVSCLEMDKVIERYLTKQDLNNFTSIYWGPNVRSLEALTLEEKNAIPEDWTLVYSYTGNKDKNVIRKSLESFLGSVFLNQFLPVVQT